jgi:hypothetical protein
MALSLFRRTVMKAAEDDQSTSYDDPDQQVLTTEPDMPGSESECPPLPEDEGQMIEEPGYGHGV